MAAGALLALISQSEERDLQSDLGDEIKKRPKYGSQNRNLAAARAFGRSKEAMIADQQIEQDAANAAFDATNVTSSTNALLQSIAAIKAGEGQARMGIQANESAMADQRLQAYIGEYDKEYEQDLNMPHQLRIAAIRDQIKNKQQLEQAGLAYEAQTTSSMLSMIGGGGSAPKNDGGGSADFSSIDASNYDDSSYGKWT